MFKSYLSQFDIVGFLETWSRRKSEFDDFLSDYKHFDSLRKKTNSSFRNDGGDSVVLLLNASRFDVKNDIILLIAYISPEGSPIYRNKDECNGILLLENKLAQIKDDYP